GSQRPHEASHPRRSFRGPTYPLRSNKVSGACASKDGKKGAITASRIERAAITGPAQISSCELIFSELYSSFEHEVSMDALDYWRFCDEVSVVQAALLIVGEDPAASQEYIADWEPE